MGLTDLETIPDSGAVFTIGRSRFADNVASHFFIRKDTVVSITCGDEHSAVICQTGRLFVFGSNDWGQLGLGHKNHVSKPSCVKALKPEKVTHVACGRAHTLICTGERRIFTCGSDQEGQLGRGASAIGESVCSPVLVYDSVSTGSKIVEIAAGSHHSLALTSDGGVLAWGSNLEGQLGLPDVSGLVNKPTKVHVPEPVKQISAGYYHSAFLTESGLIYVCGESEGGKLGIDVNFSVQVSPKRMQLPCPAVHVACGGHHTVILAENGNAYGTGSNASGQLGLGSNVSEIHSPKLLPRDSVQGETVSRISCGESHTAIVTDTGKLFACGDGRHGKLGLEENENNVHEFTPVQRYKELFVSNVACGGCHTILVGQRRRNNNHGMTKTENTQTETLQKKNSLPPLKLPINRRHSETHDERINETIKDHVDRDETAPEPVKNIQAAVEKSSGNLEEVINNNLAENTNKTVNSVKNLEKDSMEAFENSLNEAPEDSASNPAANAASEGSPGHVEGSRESKLTTEPEGSSESREKESKTPGKVRDNVEEGTNTSIVNGDSRSSENGNEAKAANNDLNEEEETTKDENIPERENEAEDKETVGNAEEKEESGKDENDNTDGTSSPAKMIVPSSSPPPKPPRLKPGSGDSMTSLEGSSSMATEKDTARKEDTPGGEPRTMTEVEEETVSRRSSTKAGSSKSTRSRVVGEEAIESAKGNDEERIIETQKLHSDNAQDDADVVQSPAPRTGKISKIFKGKRPQAMENGSRTGGNVNTKSKSKTCNIL